MEQPVHWRAYFLRTGLFLTHPDSPIQLLVLQVIVTLKKKDGKTHTWFDIRKAI